jgi:acyl carrier protein
MLTRLQITALIEEKIRSILLDDIDDFGENHSAGAISHSDSLIDLGLNSLMLARLVIQLTDQLGTDPFLEGLSTLEDTRTVGELADAYENGLRVLTEQSA